MRKYGTIDNIDFKNRGFSIYELAYEYTLSDYGRSKSVYVNNMKELRKAIADFINEDRYGQG